MTDYNLDKAYIDHSRKMTITDNGTMLLLPVFIDAEPKLLKIGVEEFLELLRRKQGKVSADIEK